MAKKSTALTKITAQAKRLRNANPRMQWVTAVKQASKEYNSGALGVVKKIATVKKKVGAKSKRVSKIAKAPYAVVRYPTTGGGNATETLYRTKTGRTNVKTITTKRVSGVNKAIKINKEIERLEKLRKQQRGQQAKDAVQVFINAEHKKLKELIALKHRSA